MAWKCSHYHIVMFHIYLYMFLSLILFPAIFAFSCAKSIFFYYISFKVNSNISYYLFHLIILSPSYILEHPCIYFYIWTFKSSSSVAKINLLNSGGITWNMHCKCNKKNFLNKKAVWLNQQRAFSPKGGQCKAGLLLIVWRAQAVSGRGLHLHAPNKILANRKDKYGSKRPCRQTVTKHECVCTAGVIINWKSKPQQSMGLFLASFEWVVRDKVMWLKGWLVYNWWCAM